MNNIYYTLHYHAVIRGEISSATFEVMQQIHDVTSEAIVYKPHLWEPRIYLHIPI